MKKNFKKIYKSKKLVLQALYSWIVSKNDIIYIEKELTEFKNQNKMDLSYFSSLITNITNRSQFLDYIIKNNSDINTHITLIENIIIKIALIEIFFYKFLSFKIIINDALNLANTFCAKRSYMLINKILNNVISCYKINRLLL